MNLKIVLLVVLTLVIIGVPASFAHPQYVSSLNAEYSLSSCGTCHVRASGSGPLNSYGTLFQTQPNHAADPGAALIAIGAPPTVNPTGVIVADTFPPSATATMTPTPDVTTVTATATPVPPAATATPAAPGFGIGLSLIGLFAWSLLAKKNK